MSYDSTKLEDIATQLIQGEINKEDLEQMISKSKCKGTDYIIDSPEAAEAVTHTYDIEDRGKELVMIKDHEKVVSVLEYFFYSPETLYLQWGKSYEPGKGYLGKLFSRAKKIAKSRGAKIILCEIDNINKRMLEIADHWHFKQGGPVKNSNNTDSFYYFYDLN